MDSVVDKGLRLARDHVDLDAGINECDSLEAKLNMMSDLGENSFYDDTQKLLA